VAGSGDGTTGQISISTTTVRSGAYAGRTGTSGFGQFNMQFVSTAGNGPYYFRAYLYVATGLDGASNNPVNIMNMDNDSGASGGNLRMTVRMGDKDTANARQLRVYNSAGTAMGSWSGTIPLNTWARLEVAYAGNGNVSARVDGTEFCTDCLSSPGTINNFQIGIGTGAGGGTPSGDVFWDDVAVNDTTGSFQNSWPGDGRIVHLRPNAAGDNSAYTNTFTNVDEVTPDDGTTTCDSPTVGQIDDHNIDDTPAVLGTDAAIQVVQVGGRAADLGASTTVYRIKASAGGTVEESGSQSPGNSTYNTNRLSGTPAVHQLTLYDLPGASTAQWTKADLDAAQIGYRYESGSANQLWSAIWLLVDFVPASEIKQLRGGTIIQGGTRIGQ
jgi:hypothetical protein